MITNNKNYHQVYRIIIYFFIFYFYLFFMEKYSPLGNEWLNWHYNRINNYAQQLKLNGYFANYGFSIFSKIENCYIDLECTKNSFYLSHLFSSKVFYLLINEFLGQNNLKFYGQLFDKTFIFLTAVLISEILIIYSQKNNSKSQSFFLGTLCFTFFVVNPWTYKMIIASWDIIFFTFFFLLGIFLILKNNEKLGIFIILISGFFEYQSSAGIAVYYFLLIIVYLIFKDKKNSNSFFLFRFKNDQIFFSYNTLIIFLLLLPVVTHFILQYLFLENIDLINPGSSSLISRIGISGDDIHNGGILGSFQFLAGNRITICFQNDFQNFISNIDNDLKNSLNIQIYNCLLSHLGIFLLSVFSIIGLFIFFKKDSFVKIIIYPIIFLILCNAFILQQSSSVHLMGYSYLFSIIFSIGLTNLILNFLTNNNSKIMIVFFIPVLIGIIFLCIRVSMLTGING